MQFFSNKAFIALTFFFFITDLFFFGFFAAPRTFLLATFFYALVEVEFSWWRGILLLGGILSETFLVKGIIGIDLLLILALAVTLAYLRQQIHLFLWADALLSVLCARSASFPLFSSYVLTEQTSFFMFFLHFIIALIVLYYKKR